MVMDMKRFARHTLGRSYSNPNAIDDLIIVNKLCNYVLQ
jgi:hypothetical protein